MKESSTTNNEKVVSKGKRVLYISLFTLDMIATISLFVISIIMLATMPANKQALENATGFIGYLQKNPNVFLLAFVVPLFILLGINIAIFVYFLKKANKEKKVALSDLSSEEKAKLRSELLKDMQKDEDNDDEDEEEVKPKKTTKPAAKKTNASVKKSTSKKTTKK